MAMLRRRQREAATPPPAETVHVAPMTEERERAWLPRIGQAALGGLGFVGGTLEKIFGGRAVRGLLGGKPQELLTLIPGSDWMGITDEANRVSGRDLLRQWKLIGNEDTTGNMLGGMALELALDPGMWTTFGSRALT